ncbi:hypothetical protein [Candidatus Amarobacter glycogenicus]|uniref:hypothetical protein n=1 Tax=Candidatus Amarobacter glycogenicus TaxID=3140699 RepID=UPI003135AA2D|nr:hypothetical protein [Dehalococcoidia bacterium]
MTMPAAESERIRGYLIGQAAKLTIPELVEKVRTDSAALKAAGESVPGNQFTWRYVSRFTNACCKRRATSTST